ncbi:methyl-coenzyme M reductase operon protein D [Methanococcus maripaludis]|uniref:Methyl-coenzyme M reductase operon protein D n=1 Tax=Methanococcus maripaludis TaxID=39152 RepID=A0A2L1CBB9_METMI|nr:methyl-coenzyme M reductase operon protein D [Methanococcus maripaludis]AVB76661.1 Methyl-coenzyme M reductase operon protein D [Methanococcus maripaludis]MBA2863171.1 methyl-coenzyme M reductase subunit D [Methanococcus maripaludis]
MIELEVFPHRYLKAETTEKFLNRAYSLSKVQRVVIHGESLPNKVGYGPAKGTPVNHSEKREITVKGVPVELMLQVGRLWVLLDDESEIEKIEEICKDLFPFGYRLTKGKFLRNDPTVSDFIKYGESAVDDIDKRLLGATDPRSKFDSSVTIIPKSEKNE